MLVKHASIHISLSLSLSHTHTHARTRCVCKSTKRTDHLIKWESIGFSNYSDGYNDGNLLAKAGNPRLVQP